MLLQEMKAAVLSQLHDIDWEVRLNALRTLADDSDPLLVDHVLPLARDPDEQVRQLALLILRPFDDRRVLSEVISALDDVDEDIRTLALELLDHHDDALPALMRVAGKQNKRMVWRHLRTQASAVMQWAKQIGQELLGRPILVRRPAYGLGRTYDDRQRREVEIEVSDVPVTSAHRHGEDIMRGLVLHEIGHHLYDIGMPGHKTTRGIAQSEEIGLLYDILCDERLERKLRARRAQWGVYFDRLAAYAFAEEKRTVPLEEYAALVAAARCQSAAERTITEAESVEAVKTAINQGELPGALVSIRGTPPLVRVRIRHQELMMLPGAIPMLGAFLLCLRGGIDPGRYPDPQLTMTLAKVPRDLKNLSHAVLLEVARKISKTLWAGQSPRGAMQQLHQTLQKFPHSLFSIRSAFDRLARTTPTILGRQPQATGILSIRQEQPPSHGSGSRRAFPHTHLPPNVNPTADFPALKYDETLPYKPDHHKRIVNSIHPHIKHLRAYLEDLNTCEIEVPASRQGRRLDMAQARRIVYRPTVNLMVKAEPQSRLDSYLGIVIDRSESMEGERLEQAIAFAVLLAESAKGVRGIEGHINAFDGETFYHLGDLQQTAVASLWASGGNNDTGALARAAELALQSHRRNKALVMISDGTPAQCTFASLQRMVTQLTRKYHIGCAQVAVAPLSHVAFPLYVDVSRCTLDQAVVRFGRLLMQLVT